MLYIYEIWLGDQMVGDSGDEIFNDKISAEMDSEYLLGYLMEEYHRPEEDFEIVMYEKEEPSKPPVEKNENYYIVCNAFKKEKK